MGRIINSISVVFLAFLLSGFAMIGCAGTEAGDPDDTEKPEDTGDGECVDVDDDDICDDEDLCMGDNSLGDPDGDGICGGDIDIPLPDADSDGINDIEDECPNDADNDIDEDGVCGDEDPCPVDNPDDSDGDGVCDGVDICEGHDDNVDADEDELPDGCDNCPNDANNDEDGDGKCADEDPCPTLANSDACLTICLPGEEDTDGDGRCDRLDACPDDADLACCVVKEDCQSGQNCDYADSADTTGLCVDIPDTDPIVTCTFHSDCLEDEYCAGDGCMADGDWDGPLPEGTCEKKKTETDCVGEPIVPVCGCNNFFAITMCDLSKMGTRFRNNGICIPIPCEEQDDCPTDFHCSLGGITGGQCIPPDPE